MRITFLVDNLPHPTLPLLTEHGLSLYIETDDLTNRLIGESTNRKIGILCDMGASGAYIKNAKALGIDLNTCHWAFLSHAHADHTGGLGKLVAQYGHIPVYASHHIPTLQCYSSRPKKVEGQRFNDSAIQHSRSELRSIGPDLNLFCGHTPWFKPIEQDTWISPDIALVHPTCSTYPKPLGNKYLTAVASQKSSFGHFDKLSDRIQLTESTKRLKLRLSESRRQTVTELVEVRLDYAEHEQLHESEARINDSTTKQQEFDSPISRLFTFVHQHVTDSPKQSEIDPFDHEIALAFVTEKGLVIVSCCSHHGALNTIASCMEFTGCNTLHAYVGGLHFVDSPEVEAETTSFIGDWLTLYPNAHLYTGHCTCPKATALLKAHIPHCHTFYTGNVVEV